ncbi:hypothetical protein ACJJI4_23895 (plasmid) [Microbulbifer sp. TRSA002]
MKLKNQERFYANGNVHLWLDQNLIMLERINHLIVENFNATFGDSK